MPDLDPLPPLPRRPSLPPRPGDFDDMTRRVRRRRKGRWAGAGSAVGVAAAVAFVMAGGPGGIDTLVADPAGSGDPARPTATSSPTPTASPEQTVSPVGEPTSGVAPSAGTSSEPAPTATAAPSPSATGASPGGPPPTVHARLARDDVPYTTSPACEAGGAEGPGWCIRTPPSATVQSAVERDYVMDACRLPGTGGGEMSFYTRDEIYFYVQNADGGQYLWGRPNWSKVSHRVTVAAGRCARFTFTWDATDQSGRPLKADRYSVSVSFYASFSGVPAGSTTYGFDLTVVD